MNDPSQMMNRSFGMWPPPLPPLPPPDDPMGFQNPRPVFASGAAAAKPGRANWKAKKAAAAADKRRKAAAAAAGAVVEGIAGAGVGGGGGGGYKPPTLNELQFQNRMKTRRFYPRKYARFAPFAPRNTTSFIIRAKRSGGIAELVSPCPVTPAILPTPKFSPSREGVVDMAKEEWGVDGYGSMKGLIRLRSSPGRGADDDDAAAAAEDGSSESDVEEHLEVERRLDHDLSRFEMVYPGGAGAGAGAGVEAYLLESRVDDQDSHIAQLEEENLTLKERIFLMEREMGDLQRRLRLIEKHLNVKSSSSTDDVVGGDNNEESNRNEVVIEETPEHDGGGDVCSEKSGGDCEDGGGGSGTPMRE